MPLALVLSLLCAPVDAGVLTPEELGQVRAWTQPKWDLLMGEVTRFCGDEQDDIEVLRKREPGFDSATAIGDISQCAGSWRNRGLPLPAELEGEARDLVAWFVEHPWEPQRSEKELFGIRLGQACSLAELDDPRALPALAALYAREPRSELWACAVRVEHPDVAPLLEGWARQGGEPDDERVFAALARQGAVAVDALANLVHSERAWVRKAALTALRDTAAPEALDALEIFAEEPALPEDERQLATANARLLAARAQYGLCVLAEPEPEERLRLDWIARAATERYGLSKQERRQQDDYRDFLVGLGERALPNMLEPLRSSGHGDGPGGAHYHHSDDAAALLVRIGDPAVPCLIHDLAGPWEWSYGYIARSLKQITGQDLGTDHEAWLGWWQAREAGE